MQTVCSSIEGESPDRDTAVLAQANNPSDVQILQLLNKFDPHESRRFKMVRSLHPATAATRGIYNNIMRLVSGRGSKADENTFPLRNANNFLKSVLVGRYVPRGKVILDIGCGRGQDIKKHAYATPSRVICVDVSERSLWECHARWRRNNYPFEACFIQDDCCSPAFLRDIEMVFYRDAAERRKGQRRKAVESARVTTGPSGQNMVDVVSCQFACHYAFYSEESARQFADNVCRVLRPGGLFMGTAPLGEAVTRLLERGNRPNEQGTQCSATALRGPSKTSCKLEQKADAMKQGASSTLHSDTCDLWVDDETLRCYPNGIVDRSYVPYHFYMKNTVQTKEWTVTRRELVRLFEERGLVLLYSSNLRDMYNTESINPRNYQVALRMSIKDDKPLGEADLDHISMYFAFVFVKPQTHKMEQ